MDGKPPSQISHSQRGNEPSGRFRIYGTGRWIVLSTRTRTKQFLTPFYLNGLPSLGKQ